MKASDFLVVLIFVVALAFGACVLCISWIANQLDLPFWEVFDEARLLMSAPVTLAIVMMIEASGAPFPLRVSNTWPLIAALFWAGLHELIKMKAEQTALDQFGGSSTAYAYHVELPWFTELWFMLSVCALIVVGGYALTAKLSSNY
ncbi:hypothetical protein CJU35_05555 [Pseudomonas aeruginosa]|uniref:hypothetical protein n=1 Tax=Pseudomonas aeruginosa TaxID=287 RepID=UPI000BB7F287|nr:hypothetical protein [Pseudomonas aeruginosa]PBV09318.1 hypothetical protein CJU35_05555 [Pseudomonas aeruginosa]